MIPDLSQIRMLTLDEVAELFRLKPGTVLKHVQNGTFAVLPRGQGKPMLWSSVDIKRYFEDPKAGLRGAAKRGPKAVKP